MKSIRSELREGYQKARGAFKKALEDPNNAAEGVKAPPAFVFAMYGKVATEIINGTRTVAISFNLNDAGLGAAVLGDFDLDSYLGKLVAKAHNEDGPVFSGLPDRPYLMYGGATLTPEVTRQVFNDFLDILKQNPGDLKEEDIDKYSETARKSLSSMRAVNFGLVQPQQGEPFIQVVELVRGDANQILDMSKQAMPFTNNMMAGMNTGKVKANIKFGDPTTVDGVELTPYKVKVEVDPNDAAAAQQKQIMDMIYGPNGVSGLMGVVNDKRFISLMTPNQKLVSDAIAAAKADKDVLGQSDALKQVSDQLPKQRGAEFYIALDNIANTAVAVARQRGLTVQFEVPPNLPPVGLSMANEGSTCRIDGFIPTKVIESITAAVLKAMNNGPKPASEPSPAPQRCGGRGELGGAQPAQSR